MNLCRVHTGLAYAATVYIFASIMYLLVSRSYGTPFKNALLQIMYIVQTKHYNGLRLEFIKIIK